VIQTPDVSLLVLTWNAGPEFPEILGRMQAQRLDGTFEILVIDSGSTDGTAEFLRRQPVRLIEISNTEFNHGLTRNLGIHRARGSIVILATQDARPADEQWMQRLVDCFADPRVAGAYSRQIPRPDTSPFIRDRLNQWWATSAEPRIQSIEDRAEFEALSPSAKLERVAFDNVSSSVRRQIALQHQFRLHRFGEDLEWAYRVLLAGYRIVYEPRSRVIHSHNYSMWYELKRVYLDHQNLYSLVGLHAVPGWWDVLRATAGGTGHLVRVVAEDPLLGPTSRLRWWLRAAPYALTQSLAEFLGARSVRGLDNQRKLYQHLDRLLRRGV
jgi:rhamnosyltransferase